MAEWRVAAEADGVRLDKYLADPERLGSRGRAADALERGKIYLNEVEVGLSDGGRRLAPGDLVRVWLDRPGTAKRQPRLGVTDDLDVVYEDDVMIVVNKSAGI